MRGLSARGGAASALITAGLAALGLIELDVPVEIRNVNQHDELLSEWHSEYSDTELPPECSFYNHSVMYKSELCSHFVLSRASSTPRQAFVRAARCMSKHKTECVLSPEIGLSVPAAFLPVSDGSDAVEMLVAPRLLAPEAQNDTRRIRVHVPGAPFSSRTLHLQYAIETEYLDGKTRRVTRRVLTGDAAYCVQLLRATFVAECWEGLD